MRKIITVLLLIIVITVPFIAFDVLPQIGDPESAPNTHVSDYYIEHAIDECNSPNMVTAVIVDYRAFDTMFETTVMFLAGIAVIMILANRPKRRLPSSYLVIRRINTSDKPVYESLNKDIMISLAEPLILLYAIYVLFHGEVSLGGGFQAGALIGMTYLLDVLTVRGRPQIIKSNKFRSSAVSGLGAFIYALTGLISIAAGGMFLEYNKLPLDVHQAKLHSIGILTVEIGITIGVAGTIITIINALKERIYFDDDNYK